MTTPRYFYFYDLPSIDLRYHHEQEYTRRCDQVAQTIYKILDSEVQIFLRQPTDLMSEMTWELCQCIGDLVDGISDAFSYGLKNPTEAQALDLLKLSHWFAHYELASIPALRELHKIFTFVEAGVNAKFLDVA
jgi:hypothetical protein